MVSRLKYLVLRCPICTFGLFANAYLERRPPDQVGDGVAMDRPQTRASSRIREWGLSENNRKAKFYNVAPAGRRRLRDEMKTWEAYAAAVAKVLGATQPFLREELG